MFSSALTELDRDQPKIVVQQMIVCNKSELCFDAVQ